MRAYPEASACALVSQGQVATPVGGYSLKDEGVAWNQLFTVDALIRPQVGTAPAEVSISAAHARMKPRPATLVCSELLSEGHRQ